MANDQDPDCLYLLKTLIENIIHVDCSQITVLNPDLNPQFFDDKDMILDLHVRTQDGEDIDVEMQNSSFHQKLYQRFQLYGSKMLTMQEKKGESYLELHHVYQILFVDDLDKDNLVLIDEYISRNERGIKEKYYLTTRVFVYLPYINIIREQKSLKDFSELEVIIYILENGLKNDIMELTNEVIKMMEKKENGFNQDEILQDMAYKRDINRKARLSNERDKYEEGIDEGILQSKYDWVVQLFHSYYPGEDTSFLAGLTIEVYQQIFEMLLNEKTVIEIKQAIK